jgi:hypothetical protein
MGYVRSTATNDHLSAFGAERVARALAPRLLKSLGLPVGASGSP